MTDAQLRYAVAGLRALARAGVQAAALGTAPTSAGLLSRHAAGRASGPDAVLDPPGFVAAVSTFARRRGPLIVYPCDERSIDALLDAGPALAAEARLPYSGPEALDRLRDKSSLAEAARAVGLATPRLLAQGTAAELRREVLPHSCVVKTVRTRGQLPARVVEGRAKVAALLDGLPDHEPLLVQERLEAPLVSLALVVDRAGNLAAVFQQRALRTWPPEAGGSSMAVGVDPDMDLAERAVALLAGAGYWGLAHLQFLRGRDGPALIDVNTRFYGSLPLATKSGVNLPAAWHAIATGAEPPPLAPYRAGVTYRWLEAELTAAYGGARRLLVTRAPRPRVGAMWAADDPLPSLALAMGAAWARIRRRLPSRPA